MKKILRVVEPFFTAELGDTFTFSDKTNLYESQTQEEFRKSDEDDDVTSSYNATFSISKAYAQELIKDGYLEEVDTKTEDKPFTNVFDEIKTLKEKYSSELSKLDEDMKLSPQCLKVERETVLSNLVKVLNHLESLKK